MCFYGSWAVSGVSRGKSELWTSSPNPVRQRWSWAPHSCQCSGHIQKFYQTQLESGMYWILLHFLMSSLLVKGLRSIFPLKLGKREADRKPFASEDDCFGSCKICFSLFYMFDTMQQWVIFTESVSFLHYFFVLFTLFFCCCLKTDTDKIHDNDRNTIKQQIVGLMLKSPEQIQKQVSRFKFLN